MSRHIPETFDPERSEFGAMSGVKIVYAAAAVAGPFCADLMAEQGADVVWIENAKAPEPTRPRRPDAGSNARLGQTGTAL